MYMSPKITFKQVFWMFSNFWLCSLVSVEWKATEQYSVKLLMKRTYIFIKSSTFTPTYLNFVLGHNTINMNLFFKPPLDRTGGTLLLSHPSVCLSMVHQTWFGLSKELPIFFFQNILKSSAFGVRGVTFAAKSSQYLLICLNRTFWTRTSFKMLKQIIYIWTVENKSTTSRLHKYISMLEKKNFLSKKI